MSKRINLTGKRFGRLEVKIFVGSTKHRHSRWECVCDCGKVIVATTLCLRRKNGTRSCGCLRPGITIDKQGKVTRLYHIWSGMKQRCFDIKSKDFPRYGGRGITICQEWTRFGHFYNWANANGYQDDLTVERINNDGNYEPGNCTWIPPKAQARNRRTSHYLTLNDHTVTIAEWAEIMCVDRGVIEQRLRRGWSIEKTLTTPKLIKEAI